MAQVQRLQPTGAGERAPSLHPAQPHIAPVVALPATRCALCGASLANQRVSYRMLSPLVAMGPVTVCRSCRRAAIGEGYVPVVG